MKILDWVRRERAIRDDPPERGGRTQIYATARKPIASSGR
jgi:hypothetical protein